MLVGTPPEQVSGDPEPIMFSVMVIDEKSSLNDDTSDFGLSLLTAANCRNSGLLAASCGTVPSAKVIEEKDAAARSVANKKNGRQPGSEDAGRNRNMIYPVLLKMTMSLCAPSISHATTLLLHR